MCIFLKIKKEKLDVATMVFLKAYLLLKKKRN